MKRIPGLLSLWLRRVEMYDLVIIWFILHPKTALRQIHTGILRGLCIEPIIPALCYVHVVEPWSSLMKRLRVWICFKCVSMRIIVVRPRGI